MVVNSHNIEFGYELLSAVPYAYELYLQGKLTGTISGNQSEPLYYFSPNHQINPKKRSWYNTQKARSAGLPYTMIHKPELQPKHFPPYKTHFANDEFKWKKPTLCICNRANIEWGTAIINFFDADILEWLFSNLKDKYEIIYFPIGIPESIQDNGTPEQVFDDISLAKKHGVKVFTDLIKSNWNDTLLKVFANCEHYITMNGGYSILASFFSGQNIIYSKPGATETKEIKIGSFWHWYPNINNVQTLHVPSHSTLKEKVQALYIDELPTASVIIRTSNRPKAFQHAIGSVLRQSYKNVNIIVTCDDKSSLGYTQPYNCRVIEPDKLPLKIEERKFENYSTVSFPYNDYIRQAQEKVKGYIFFLDDDDKFTDDRAIEKVIAQMKPDKLAIWKVQFPNRVVPGRSFGIKPTLCDVTGIGLCYHSSMIHKSDWSPWKCADYRTAAMWGKDEIIWIDEILTGLQSIPGRGERMDIGPKNVKPMEKKARVKVQFIKNFQNYKAGQVVELPWIVAVNYYYRNFVIEVEEPKQVISKDEVAKEQKPAYQDKELKVKRTRKTKKNENPEN